MKKDQDFLNDPTTLFGRLRSACADEWEAFCTHEFVRRIGDATLPEECFRHYLLQDYIFLMHFCRAWALAVYKAETLTDMRAAAATLDAHLNYEMDLHVKYCAVWGIGTEEMEGVQESRANMAYTRYVLERGLSGDILDLYVALAPCVIGYATIGRNLVTDPRTALEGNPYRDWIDVYAGDEYQQVAQDAIKQLDELARPRTGPGRFESLVKTFRQATSLETGFWDMGLHLQG